MLNDINLLPRKESASRKQLNQSVRVLQVIAIFLMFLVPSAAIVLFLLILFSPLDSLQQTENSLVTEVSHHEDAIGRVTLINNRLVKANSFLSTQGKDDAIINQFLSELPDKVKIDSINLHDTKMQIQTSSTSLQQLSSFHDIVSTSSALVTNSKFQSIFVDLTNNDYALQLTMDIKGNQTK